MTLKDNYNTADLPTTGGSLSLQGARPAKDAFVVARLRAAGVVDSGCTAPRHFRCRGAKLRTARSSRILRSVTTFRASP
jgi:amidase